MIIIKIEKKYNESITSGTEAEVGSLRDILKIAQTHPIVCISACCYRNKNNPVERKKATEDLETLIAAGYDYITVNGGWVEATENGNSEESVEKSFIVIGHEYGEPSERLEHFEDHMIQLCREFGQWAILLISWAEDHELVDEVKEYNREQAYHTFIHSDYIDENNAHEIDSKEPSEEIKQDALNLYEKLKEKDHLELYELYGKYLDGNGKTIKVFNNVNADMIGGYFTTMAKEAGADKFTLLASDMHFYSRFTPTSLAEKFITVHNSEHPIERQRNVIMAKRFPGSSYWEETRDKLQSYLNGETQWEWGVFKGMKRFFHK